jgi:hypothetical protein
LENDLFSEKAKSVDPKSKARNPKQTQRPKFECSKIGFLSLGHSIFEFVSSRASRDSIFEFRILGYDSLKQEPPFESRRKEENSHTGLGQKLASEGKKYYNE